jgi:glycosyltransferase involved in cell wall biosynthesis
LEKLGNCFKPQAEGRFNVWNSPHNDESGLDSNMAALRVAHLVSGDLWAGAEAASLHLIRALHRRADVDVVAVLLNAGVLEERLRDAGVSVALVPEPGRGFLSLARSVRTRLSRTDLVHAHRYKENLLAALSGRPWIATQHGRPEPFRGIAAARMAAYQRLDLTAKRFSARRVVAVSSEIEEWLASRVGRGRAVHIPNGIEDPAPRVQPTAWGERPRVVGTVGRLEPVKGLALAIDAVARTPALELEIVGEGREQAALEARATASSAAGRIRFVGFEADPLPRIASWRAMLLPSLHEGNPISVLESLSLGTPVVASDLPGVAEMLAGTGGWCIAGRDPDRWAAQLERVVEAGARASDAARSRFLEAFTDERVASRMRDLYKEVLAGPAPG